MCGAREIDLHDPWTIPYRSGHGAGDSFGREVMRAVAAFDVVSDFIIDLSLVGALKNLTRLDLYYNKITDLSPLQGLKNLTELNLGYNEITDISPLEGLKNLTELKLSWNQVSDISPVQGLTNVTNLNLRDNDVKDISPLQGLKNLTGLDLRSNRIKRLPPEILELGMEIGWKRGRVEKGVNLCGNPLESPPVDIVKQGMHAIREYFKSLGEEERRLLNEVNVLLVGDGGASKTSLVNRLIYDEFDEADIACEKRFF